MDNLALDIISRWDFEEFRQKIIFDGDREEAERYLQAVDEIQISCDQSAIAIAMARLEDEFRNILISQTNPTSSLHHLNTKEEEKEPQNSYGCFRHLRFNASARRHDAAVDNDDKLLHSGSLGEMVVIPFSTGAINDLRCIAERMVSPGYLCHCIHAYASVRKSAIFANFPKLDIGDVQLPVKAKIQRWINASTFCVRTLFGGEKKLCEQIFDGVGPEIDHACFMETVKEPSIQFLNFADATCINPTSSRDMLIKILDLHNALAVLMPDFDDVFDFQSSESIRVAAAEVLSRLAEAVRWSLSEFENALLDDTSEVVVPPSGSIYPLTTYVMYYLNFICDYMI